MSCCLLRSAGCVNRVQPQAFSVQFVHVFADFSTEEHMVLSCVPCELKQWFQLFDSCFSENNAYKLLRGIEDLHAAVHQSEAMLKATCFRLLLLSVYQLALYP